MKNTIQHKTHARLIALAVVQTQSMTYMAQCAGSSTSKMCDLQHIYPAEAIHQRNKVCCIAVITV